jgi:opacity protein-like surface antigen
MKKYIFLTLLFLASISIQAQDSIEIAVIKEKSYKPTKKNFTVGINLGNSSFLRTGLRINNGSAISGEPTLNPVNVNSNSATNMVGAEVRYFLSKKWAITLSGGVLFSNTPADLAIPAVLDANNEMLIPGYNAVVADTRLDISYSLGALYFFDYKRNQRLMPYLGFLIPVNHSNRSLYDPTTNADGTVSLGTSTVEIGAIGLQAVAGIDYFLTENIFFGLSIQPVSFMFIKNARYPAPGLFSRKINNTSFSSFVQPMLKIGFKL